MGFRLLKVKGITFQRIRDNEFVAVFVDDLGNPLMTMDVHEVFEGEQYDVWFNSTLVVGTDMPQTGMEATKPW